MAVVLASLNERRRELAILRSTGASPVDIFILLATEGVMLTTLGILAGLALLAAASLIASPWLEHCYGIALRPWALDIPSMKLLAAVWATGLVASLFPGWHAYRLSLADGLQPRL